MEVLVGDERWLKLASEEEAQRLRDYLGDHEELGVEGDFGWWLQWSSEDPLRFEAGYSYGALQSEGAAMVCREIVRRFKVTSIGSSSGGWYDDKGWQGKGPKSLRETYGPFTSWVEWMESYKIEFSLTYKMFTRYPDDWSHEIEKWSRIEGFVTEWFRKLDGER